MLHDEERNQTTAIPKYIVHSHNNQHVNSVVHSVHTRYLVGCVSSQVTLLPAAPVLLQASLIIIANILTGSQLLVVIDTSPLTSTVAETNSIELWRSHAAAGSG
jgi:hypothetical protein